MRLELRIGALVLDGYLESDRAGLEGHLHGALTALWQSQPRPASAQIPVYQATTPPAAGCGPRVLGSHLAQQIYQSWGGAHE